MKHFLFLNLTTILVLSAQVTIAKPSAEIKQMAQSITVKIQLGQKTEAEFGSGVIINRQGDMYTLVTNKHVVCGRRDQKCNKLPEDIVYRISTMDGKDYQIKAQDVKLLADGLDLATMQFRSNQSYSIAKIAGASSLKADDQVHTAGFPAKQKNIYFDTGKAVAVVYSAPNCQDKKL
jgi:S1-C subfamily serine protease